MAWWGEKLARQTALKPLTHYLDPPTPAQKRAAGAAKVRGMFERIAAKSAQANGTVDAPR